MIVRSTTFNITFHDGTKESITLDVQGYTSWTTDRWSDAQEFAILLHLKSLGHKTRPLECAWYVNKSK